MTDKPRLIEEGIHLVADDASVKTKDMLLWVRQDGEFLVVDWDSDHNFTDDELDEIKELLIDSCDREKARRIRERH